MPREDTPPNLSNTTFGYISIINVRMSIASSTRFDSNYVVGVGFFRSEDVRSSHERGISRFEFAQSYSFALRLAPWPHLLPYP